MFTLLSTQSMLSKLAALLTDEETASSWNPVRLVVDNQHRSGVEGLRQTVRDVRAGRAHNIDIEHTNGTREAFMVNYCANRN